MGKIIIHLYGTLANRAGIATSSCEVEADGKPSLREVFELVAQRYGRQFWDTVVDPATGELQPHLHAVINSQSVQRLNGLDTPVDSRDHILIHVFGAMRGGSFSAKNVKIHQGFFPIHEEHEDSGPGARPNPR